MEESPPFLTTPPLLSSPSIFLNLRRWRELCHRVSSVFHNAAWVHGVLSYRDLKKTNVGGTLEVKFFPPLLPSSFLPPLPLSLFHVFHLFHFVLLFLLFHPFHLFLIFLLFSLFLPPLSPSTYFSHYPDTEIQCCM
jgi:hypothetical protein